MNDPLWRTRDGRIMFIWQMSDSHLAHAIALIRRSHGWRREYLDRLVLEQHVRALGLTTRRNSYRV